MFLYFICIWQRRRGKDNIFLLLLGLDVIKIDDVLKKFRLRQIICDNLSEILLTDANLDNILIIRNYIEFSYYCLHNYVTIRRKIINSILGIE